MIRSIFPHPAITTDVIAGFAGETEEEFEETRAFVKQAGFSQLHVFPYSRRKGTRADKMQGQLSKAEKAERARLLIRDGEELQKTFMQQFIGTHVEILSEEIILHDGKEFLTGFTPEYVRVMVPKEAGQINQLLDVVPFEIQEVGGDLVLFAER